MRGGAIGLAGLVWLGCASGAGSGPATAPAARGEASERGALPRVIEIPAPRGPAARAELPSPNPVDRRLPDFRPLGVRWSPARVEEGTAVALRLLQPVGGRRVRSAEGELGGRPVRLARAGKGWFGLAPIPIGTSGPLELVLRLEVEPDSAVEQRVTLAAAPREFPATTLRVEPRFTSPPPEALARIERERARVREVLAHVTPRWLAGGAFVAPRPGRVTSPFGQRRLFNGELRSRHLGLDLAGREGEPVRAAGSGRVALADELYYAGRAVYLDHGLGVYTGYFHLSRIRVREGESVEAGQVIGEVGGTGRVTAPHLHWSLYVAGESLDALSLLAMEVPGPATP